MQDRALNRALIALAAGVFVLLIGFGFWMYGQLGSGDVMSGAFQESEQTRVDIGGAFNLTDHTGRQVTEADFAGGYTLMYFGFTYCPDFCPAALQVVTAALDQLEEQDPDVAKAVTPIFVSVDPERDTVEAMADYVGHFHPRMVGLTGTPEQIAEAAKNYRIYYQRVESEAATYYLVDHSTYLYLIGPDSYYVTHFSHDATSEEVAERVKVVIGG